MNGSILGIDAGEKRIGLAIAGQVARLPRPLTTLPNDARLFDTLQRLIKEEMVQLIVVGLPRSLKGEETAQTRWVRGFAENLRRKVNSPIVFQDEALSSKTAEQELLERGKPYAKVEVDALAAAYILDDYLKEHSKTSA